MTVLAYIGAIAIVLFVMVLIGMFANLVCKPKVGDSAVVRMENRASREIEQMLYKALSGCALAVVVLIFYGLYEVFGR